MKPLTSDVERQVEAVLEAFCTAYRLDHGKDSTCYPLELKPQTRADLVNSIATHLGTTFTDAKIAEILAEVTDLHKLDGQAWWHEGEEFYPGDDGYVRALEQQETKYRQWIRHLIQEQMK